MRRIAPLVAVLLGLALLPSSAAAGIDRALSVLPPGESGFVTDAGTGTGSPHLYDQMPLYVNFRWKNALFGRPGKTEHPRSGIKIVRDRFGVPAITGRSQDKAWWGVGYAAAQDRLTELELFRRSAEGRLAEVLGESSLADDEAARRDLPTPQNLAAQVARLPARLRARLRAYRDGINAWIQHVREHPSDQPVEFSLLGVPLRNWSVNDLAALSVQLVRIVPRDQGRELQNALALRNLGKKKFARIVPLRPKGAPLIVPRSAGAFPSQPGRTRNDERIGFDRSAKFVAGLSLPKLPTTPGARRVAIQPGGSYAIAVRRGSGGVLYSGPQLGFAFPELFWEVEVHAPGLDVRGATAPGAAVVAVGFNKHVAWGVTSGESDADDLYAEKLKGPEKYVFKGKVRKMSCRNETFLYKSGSSTKSKTDRFCDTVHGPVQERSGKFAYARRFAVNGREIQTLVGLDALDRSHSVKDAGRALGKVTWNENVTALDDQGHLGFWHPGLLPLRPKRWDERLPFPGTGQAEWRGFLKVSQRPHVIDPKRGWLANWNNRPSAAWTEGDAAARGRLDGRLHRANFLYGLVRRLAKKPSLGALEKLLHRSGTTSAQRPLVAGRLHEAEKGSSGHAQAVLRTIVNWDGSFARTNSKGTVDPGVAAWEAFKAAAAKIALDRLGPGAYYVDGENAAYHFFDAQNGVAYALRTLSKADYRKAAAKAYTALVAQFKTAKPRGWREPRHLFDWTLQGGGSPPDMPFFERGTFEQLLELK